MIYSKDDVKRMLEEFKKLHRYETDSWGQIYDTSKCNACLNDGPLVCWEDLEKIVKKIEDSL